MRRCRSLISAVALAKPTALIGPRLQCLYLTAGGFASATADPWRMPSSPGGSEQRWRVASSLQHSRHWHCAARHGGARPLRGWRNPCLPLALHTTSAPKLRVQDATWASRLRNRRNVPSDGTHAAVVRRSRGIRVPTSSAPFRDVRPSGQLFREWATVDGEEVLGEVSDPMPLGHKPVPYARASAVLHDEVDIIAIGTADADAPWRPSSRTS